MLHLALRERQCELGASVVSIDQRDSIAHYGSSEREYDAAITGVALYDASAARRLWMRDRDRASLLHRLSTNHIETLYAGQGCRTVLTNHNGRIIDLLTVHVLDDQLLVVSSPQQHDGVFTLLRKNIFFNDKVRIEEASQTLGQLTLYGPMVESFLHTFALEHVLTRPLYSIVAAEIGGVKMWLSPILPLGGNGISLYIPADGLLPVWNVLVAAGATPLGYDAYEQLRIEAGYGAFGRELSLEYIPLETGLLDAISFNKGCYVGQEIIARMESRNRLAKHLCHIRLSGAEYDALPVPQPGNPISLMVNGKEAGDLTSVTLSPRFGAIGLAYVRTAYSTPGTLVHLADSVFQGEVFALGTLEPIPTPS